MSNPGFELEKAIVTKLEDDSRWTWPIYPLNPNPGKRYLEINNITTVDVSAKVSPSWQFLFSFDAWDTSFTADTGTNENIFEMLFVMETILTLDNHAAGLTALTVTGYRDVSHQPESGPEIMPNIDKAIRHARQVIKFTIEV